MDDFTEYHFEGSSWITPWYFPCWNSEWEWEYDDKIYRTIHEWNAAGRIIKKGEKLEIILL